MSEFFYYRYTFVGKDIPLSESVNTKTNNFKALNIGIILKIVKLKVWLMVVPLMEVSYLL